MKLELSVHASKLKNVAGALKGTSDPYAVVTHVATTPGSLPKVLGKTEVIKNSLSPNWTKVISLDYEMGEPYKVAIQVYDEVKKGDNKNMGVATFEIGEVLGARGSTKARKLKNGGTLFCHVAKKSGSGLLRLQMKAKKLTNTEGMFRKSDPFYELSNKRNAAGNITWDAVFRSEVVKDNLSPSWKNHTVELSQLCQGDLTKPVMIAVYDHESDGKHVLMGQVEATVDKLVQIGLSNGTLKLKKKGNPTGELVVTNASVSGVEQVTQQMATASLQERPVPTPASAPAFVPSSPTAPTFADYVAGGLELNVSVAIDFTGSNGDPRKPGTLHYLHTDGQMNDYEKAISSIVSILSKYDSDQKYPVYGFGAKYGGIVRHCFQCGSSAEVHGVRGILDAYHQTFRSGLIMSGPTDITEVLQTAAARATSAQENAVTQGKQVYSILLIVTDGSVSDVNATAQILTQIHQSPLSVVIVGVGNADFSAMQFLDDASTPQTDIAQFVAFNQHYENPVSLTRETLHEIPDQVVRYFQRNNIAPLRAVFVEDDEIAIEPENDGEIDLSLAFQDDGDIVVAGGGQNYTRGYGSY